MIHSFLLWITDAHALQVEVEASPLLSEHVQCLTAPYESDAQLAYLSQRRLVDLVITEDSDLLLYGARAVLFKLDNDGNVCALPPYCFLSICLLG